MSLPTITLYDTLRRQRVALEPLEPGRLGIYVCGVTVYDYAHVGHARSFISFDIIVRYLRHRGYDVHFVRNHTDIDDKIIRRANERGEEALALASRFIQAFDEDMANLGCVPPNVAPKVSDHLAEIITMIETLIERGHAYVVDNDVFYDVSSFEGYGKLSGRKLEDMRAGERVAIDERKRHPFDFALWKSAKPDEPSWPSPWGAGRPGWHIECSAMSERYLGKTFDIHGGGADLQFPHHENEIAQSEGAHGCCFARNWMHVAMLNIDGEKMSKSLGNFWTIRDVLAAHHPEALRYFMMTAHYRKQVNYSPLNLEIARERVQYLYKTREAIGELRQRVELPEATDADIAPWAERAHKAMDDDFNTPQLLAVVNEAAREANDLLATKKLAKKADVLRRIAAIESFLLAQASYTGVGASDPGTVLDEIRDLLVKELQIDTAQVEALIAERNKAREARAFERADELRDELAAMHIVLMDSSEGTRWRVEPPSQLNEETEED